ncbi:MAG: Ig-like domain-containing protein [Oscillospiraceae bacterium]
MKKLYRTLVLLLAVFFCSASSLSASAFFFTPPDTTLSAALSARTEENGGLLRSVFSVMRTELLSQPVGSAPVAENLDLQTYRNVPLSARFSAVDADGDAVTFQLTDKPARGEVTIDTTDPSCFLYSPYENKTGKDTFTYVAIDAAGNVSQPATVRVVIKKPSTKITYADLADSTFQRAAIRLAEEDIFVGECMGGTYFFRPETQVSRADFLSAALTTLGVTDLSTVSKTGFADDSAIPSWAKPYAATGLKLGAVRGLRDNGGQIIFSSGASITLAEASVILNRLLGVSDIPTSISRVDQAVVPTWAYQSTANLAACGVLSHVATAASLSSTLTRGEMADLLCAALDFSASRAGAYAF